MEQEIVRNILLILIIMSMSYVVYILTIDIKAKGHK